MREYKVLAQSDSFWRDRFSPSVLEAELNKLARRGWRVVTCTTTEFTGLGGLGTKRHELFVLLEKDLTEEKAEPPLREVEGEGEGYDPSLIPENRWYANEGNVSTILVNAGAITKQQLQAAREEFGRRGGHLCDHLLALGFVSEDELATHLKKR